MTTGSVHMTMFQFFSGRLPNIGHFHIEMEGDSSHGVVTVKNDLVSIDIDDGD